jgi:lipoyl-dependent peroxiredoxin
MPTRNATARWEGGIKGGKGRFEGESGGISGPYTVGSRFESEKGSNPEELLAAAHAACFSMALAVALDKSGTPATFVETRAACTVEKAGEGWKISSMKLTTRAKVPGISDADFRQKAEGAKEGCPVSGAFKGNMRIELDAKLEK